MNYVLDTDICSYLMTEREPQKTWANGGAFGSREAGRDRVPLQLSRWRS